MSIIKSYETAKELYAQIGVDTDSAIEALAKIPVSIHCWQGDDVGGFENRKNLTGGIAATGNFPGKATTPDELRCDIKKMLEYIPGANKLSLHASYLETNGKKVERDEVLPEHFSNWVEFAKENNIGLDFNATFFSHPLGDGYSLSSLDPNRRKFWLEHLKRSREISSYLGKTLGSVCVNNIWLHDGEKEVPIDTLAPRLRLKEGLDAAFAEKMDPNYHLDSLESKLFGIGSEAYVVGSHEFYMGYCSQRDDILLTLDSGHFHPTEVISSKLSALLMYIPALLIHVSRPMRWDSDHVVAFDDETQAMFREIVRLGALNKVYIATDYFDASINRIIAWTVGVRNVKKAILAALLQPVDTLKKLEVNGDYSSRLAVQEELKTMPLGAVFNYFCETNDTPSGFDWIKDAKKYEAEVLLKR